MSVVDLLVTIVVVTILVTIVLAVITYVAYKLRMARRPVDNDEDTSSLRYFVRYEPDPDRPEAKEPEPASSDAGGSERRWRWRRPWSSGRTSTSGSWCPVWRRLRNPLRRRVPPLPE